MPRFTTQAWSNTDKYSRWSRRFKRFILHKSQRLSQWLKNKNKKVALPVQIQQKESKCFLILNRHKYRTHLIWDISWKCLALSFKGLVPVFFKQFRRHSTKGLIPKEPKQVIVNMAGVPYPNHLGEPELGQSGRSKNKKNERNRHRRIWTCTIFSVERSISYTLHREKKKWTRWVVG